MHCMAQCTPVLETKTTSEGLLQCDRKKRAQHVLETFSIQDETKLKIPSNK